MDPLYPAYFCVAMLCGAASGKNLTPTIAFVVALACIYPDQDWPSALVGIYVASIVWANFRD